MAAGLSTTVAQVYSLNVVGYYNITVAANAKVMIANQLNTTNNTIGALIPNGPPNANIFKWNGTFLPYQFDDVDLVWKPDGLATLAPGEGAFYLSPVATTLTFVGEVLQGTLTVPNGLPTNTKVLRSSMVPQQGLISTDLALPGEPNDNLFTWTGTYNPYQFDDVDLVWKPSEPTIKVGESFFYVKAGTATTAWVRNFTVQ
jgi:hypothetical protein